VTRLKVWRQAALDRLSAAGIERGELEPELTRLLTELAGLNRVTQVTSPDLSLTEPQLTALEEALQRRERREPLSQILGRWSFWGLELLVGPEVLTPRPDTELLVEEALKWLERESASWAQPPLVVDVCAGTGCVGLAIASERPCELVMIELCESAFGLLERNSERCLKAGALKAAPQLRRGDLLSPLKAEERPQLIVSNPPYISHQELEELMPEVRDFEPRLALDGGEDGLELVRALSQQALSQLAPGGALMMEVGWRQTEEVASLLSALGYQEVRVRSDYGGNPRVVIGVLSSARSEDHGDGEL